MNVTVARGLRYDPADDLAAVRAVVPAWWWRGVEVIQFKRRVAGGQLVGSYCDGVIEVSCGHLGWRDSVRRTIVHELAHHVDRAGRFSLALAHHRKHFRRLHPRSTGAAEYWARGAEDFFLGDRRTLEKEHPALAALLRGSRIP